MAYFPFFVDLKNKKCCIIGGGNIALRKAQALLEFEADITVIAPVICEGIRRQEGQLHLITRNYSHEDLDGAFAVIAATDDPQINSEVSKVCMERNILVNVVDEPDQCNFYFPAYIKRGNLSIGISTSGKSPVLAGHIKNAIQEMLPDYYEALAETLGSFREYVKQEVPCVEDRSYLFKELAKIGIDNGGNVTLEDVKTLIFKINNKDNVS